MRAHPFIIAAAAAVCLCGVATSTRANLALSLNSHASISSLSAQLMAQPRSAAGNKKNTWDADPPLPAVAGVHYFLYNLDSTLHPLPQGSHVMTMTGARFGPGYTGTIELLVRDTSASPTMFIQPNIQTQQFNLNGMQELGLARVTFSLNVGTTPGQINEDNDVELAYDASDINGQPSNTRGVEQVRFLTEYLDHTPAAEALVARGIMTTVVPSAYAGLAPPGQTFNNGFLDFGNDNIALGSNVYSATVATNPLAQTWISSSNGVWEDGVRWQDGAIANGANDIARFNQVDMLGVITVSLNDTRTIGGFNFADVDPTSPGGYRFVGAGITLTGTAPVMTFGTLEANSRARFDNVLGGNNGLSVVGINGKGALPTGGLWLTAANTYTGGTTLTNANVYLGSPVNAASTASFGATGSTVTLNGFNNISNATTGTSGQITLNHNFIASAGSISTFYLGNRGDFGISSGNPATSANSRSVTGSGSIILTLGTTVSGDRVYSDFTGYTGRLVFNGSGTALVFVGTGNGMGFVGSGFGGSTVVLADTAVLAFQTNAAGNTVNFGALSGASTTAGITTSSAGPATLSIGALNAPASFSGFIGGSSNVTKVGSGTQALLGANNYTGVTTVLAGTLSLSPVAQAPVLGSPNLLVPGGGDIRGGTLALQYTVAGSLPATVKSILTTGFNQSPAKFATGKLRSTTIDAGHVLGWRDDTAASQVEVAYTIAGDTDLNFVVNFDDLLAMAQNYGAASGKVWAQGDFNYDGATGFDDLLSLAQNYGHNALQADGTFSPAFAADWALAQSLVPEPTTLAALVACGAVIGRRRIVS